MAGLLVAVACVAVNAAFWWPLQYPPRWIGAIVGIFAPTSCAQYPIDSWKYDACGWGLAAFSLSGISVLLVLVILFRASLRQVLRASTGKLPHELGFLWPPLLATLAFTMAWAGIPFHSFQRDGLVWDGFFPALVGVVVWAMLRYRRLLFQRIPKVLAKRDKLPEWAKWAIAWVVVVAGAWAVTEWLTPPPFLEAKWYEMYPPARDQTIALLSLFVTFALWAPRLRARSREGSA